MALEIQHHGGTCDVVDTATGRRVEGPFTSDDLARHWISEQGPAYEYARRQEQAASEEQEGEEGEAAA